MNFLIDKCSVFPLTEQLKNQCRRFSCGDKDLDDFFYTNSNFGNTRYHAKSRGRNA